MVEDTKLEETATTEVDAPATQQTAPADESSAIRNDQAEGLRNLFGAKVPNMVCMACALDADTAATMAIGTAHALRQQNQRVLLIDEIPLQDRRNMTGLAYKVRYDIAQVMENDIALEQAIQKVENNLWFAAGLRMARSYNSRKLRTPSLYDRILKSEFEFDLMLLATTDPIEGVLRSYARDIRYLVVAAPDEASMIRALEFIRTLSVQSDGAKIPVLIVGGDTEEAGKEAFARIETASMNLLDQPLEFTGWIAAVTLPYATKKTPEPAGLILPATLYSKLAGTAMQLEKAP